MYINQVTLINYRNYIKQTVKFSENINIFLGENAQGKTNLIESLFMLALTKSHRTNNDKELIHWNEPFCSVEATVKKKYDTLDLKIIIHSKGKKLLMNGLEQERIGHYLGRLHVVLFSPEDLSIVKGSPQLRRRFIDIELGQINDMYLKHLAYYRKILKQRNSYLKGHVIDYDYLDILTETLIEHGAHILMQRLTFIENLQKYAVNIHNHITREKDSLILKYISQINIDTLDIESFKNKYWQLYETYQKREIEQKTTLFGPHRDDMAFFVNDKNVQTFGSQGQQRTVALSLKLAEIDFIFDLTGEYPVLLLDDVLSELDDFRQTYLLKSIENKVQTFITTTNIKGIKEHILDTPKIFKVSKGSVEVDG